MAVRLPAGRVPLRPGDDTYTPPLRIVQVTWGDENQARELRSTDEVTAAADAGGVSLEETLSS